MAEQHTTQESKMPVVERSDVTEDISRQSRSECVTVGISHPSPSEYVSEDISNQKPRQRAFECIYLQSRSEYGGSEGNSGRQCLAKLIRTAGIP